jgi:hypothetical protein
MRRVLNALSKATVVAAIVATLVYLPFGVLLVLVLRLFGIPYDSLLTFGGTLNVGVGLLAWWLCALAGACGYVAWVFPWGDKAGAWPGRK